MPNQKGAKRAQKVLTRKRKIETKTKKAGLRRTERKAELAAKAEKEKV